MRILFDKNVPVGVRRLLVNHEVRTFVQTGWRVQLENGELLRSAEEAGFDVMVTSDQNIRYQQNLTGRKLALVVPGSNIWPIVSTHAAEVTATVDGATPGKLSVHRNAATAETAAFGMTRGKRAVRSYLNRPMHPAPNYKAGSFIELATRRAYGGRIHTTDGVMLQSVADGRSNGTQARPATSDVAVSSGACAS